MNRKSMFSRFAMDDGRHWPPEIVIDEDASTAVGRARYRATCICGTVSEAADSLEEARLQHIAHINTRLGPSRGPAWLPLEARIVLLMSAMLMICLACYASGELITHSYTLTGTFGGVIQAGSVIVGFALAFGLMVAVRRFIGPTRDGR